jgi:hypothetical protein
VTAATVYSDLRDLIAETRRVSFAAARRMLQRRSSRALSCALPALGSGVQ